MPGCNAGRQGGCDETRRSFLVLVVDCVRRALLLPATAGHTELLTAYGEGYSGLCGLPLGAFGPQLPEKFWLLSADGRADHPVQYCVDRSDGLLGASETSADPP